MQVVSQCCIRPVEVGYEFEYPDNSRYTIRRSFEYCTSCGMKFPMLVEQCEECGLEGHEGECG